MRLYKDYKKEQERIQKEEEDRKNIGFQEETIIIYEIGRGEIFLRSVKNILMIIFLLAFLVLIAVMLFVFAVM